VGENRESEIWTLRSISVRIMYLSCRESKKIFDFDQRAEEGQGRRDEGRMGELGVK
jgi:hypothetical protein